MKWINLFHFLVLAIFLLVLPACLAAVLSTDNIEYGCRQRNLTATQRTPGNYDMSKLTPYQCVMLCVTDGSQFAGVTNGNLCICLNTVVNTNVTCDIPCSGDASLTCGGLFGLKIFNLSTLVRSGPQLKFHAPQFLKERGYLVTINKTTTSKYKLTYKATGFLNESNTDQVFEDSYNYTFTTWGDAVELIIVVVGNIRQEFKTILPVKVPMSVSNFHCPDFVAVGLPFECTGRLELGKEVTMSWNVDGSNGTINLADPVSWYIGEPVPRWVASVTHAPPLDGLVVPLTTGVTTSVTVYAWELNAIKAGSIKIVVYRPVCAVGTTFCPTAASCCPINNKFSSELCNERTFFCGTSTLAISSENCSSSDVINPVSLFDSYKAIGNFTFDVIVGYNLKRLAAEKVFEYLPGDIIGWYKTKSGATLAVDLSHGQYTVYNTSIPSGTPTKYPGSVLIAGIATKSSEFVTNINGLSTEGVKNLSFVYKAREEEVELIRTVSFLYPIGNISFTNAKNSCSLYGPLNEAFNLSISYDRKMGAKILWKINNITVESSPHLTQNFTLPMIGEYALSVLVTNGISGKLLTATVHVQEKIIGLNAGKTNERKIAYQAFDTQLNVSIDAGTNVTYKWYFGDGSNTVTVKNNSVKHSYLESGQINTTVVASNMVSSKDYFFIINVSNPVEIVVPPTPISNVSTNITCRLLANLSRAYEIIVQIDNEALVSSNCNTIQRVLTPGEHDIHCYIHMVVVLYANTSLYANEPITGLSILDIPPLKLGSEHKAQANVTTGNKVSYSWLVSGKTYPNSSAQIVFNKTGQINVVVNAFNVISNQTAQTIVTVQEPIGYLSIDSSAHPAAKTDANIFFNINPSTGSDVNYTVNVTTLNGYYLDLGRSPSFTYVFLSEGIYDIFISAKNLISSCNTTYAVAVQEPVIFPLDISCQSAIRKNMTYVLLTTKFWTFTASVSYATNVTFVWTWQTNDTTTDYSPNKTKLNFLTSTQNKSFVNPKTFDVTVIAKNDVSNLSQVLHVETLDEVSDFDFQFPQAVAVDTIFFIKANISKGSNVAYSYIIYNDRNETIDPETGATLNKVGVYRIVGKATNLVSSKRRTRDIIVQKYVTGVIIKEIKTVETDNSTDIVWNVTGGTNVTSDVDFGDMRNKTIKYSECQLDAPTSSYNCSTRHKWNNAGVYTLRINASNLLNITRSERLRVIVQDRIENFSVSINNGKTSFNTHEYIPLRFSVKKGSDVRYKIYLNDGDQRVKNTSKIEFNITYYKAKTYNPRFEAYNDISGKRCYMPGPIEVAEPVEPVALTGLTVSAKPTKYRDETKFEISYKTGALFKCKMKFGDDDKDINIEEENLHKGVSYSYKKPKNYDSVLTCWNKDGKNKVSAEKTVFVHSPIKGFRPDSSSVTSIYKENITLNFEWADASNMDVVAYSEKTKPVHWKQTDSESETKRGSIELHPGYFPKPGHYTLRVNASNKVSSLNKPAEVRVHVIEKIKGAKILVNPWVAVGYVLRAYLTVDKGSALNVTWDFGDGTTAQSNCIWKSSCYFDHNYTEAGTFLISATATNHKSSDTGVENVTIQHPIRGWKFDCERVSQGSPSNLKLVRNSSFPYPTDATYEVTFDQNEPSGKKSEAILNTSNPIEVTHTYPKQGCYSAKVIMKNKVSQLRLECLVKVQGHSGQANITAKSKGDSDDLSYLPIEYPVEFSSNIDNNCLTYKWTVTKDGKVVKNVSVKSFDHTFSDPGYFEANLTVYDKDNSTNKVKAAITKFVDKSVTGLFLTSKGVGKVNSSVEFTLLWATLGDLTKFDVDYGDGYGKQNLSLTDKTKNLSSSNLPFDPKGLEGIIFYRNFSKTGSYHVKVRVNSKPKLETSVSVSEDPCPLPIITVNGGSKDVKKAPQLPYEAQYTIFSTVKITEKRCSGIKIDFNWKIFEADEYLLSTTSLSVIPPDPKKEIKKTSIETDQSALAIPKKSLEPRLYIFQLNANVSSIGISSQHIVYLRIKKPPLIVEIQGGSARSVAWNKEFTLDASSSVDPLGKRSLVFKWRCKLKEISTPGGCFGGGEELSARKGYDKTKFREKRLLETYTYQFTVEVSDDERSGNYTQEIKAIPGKPPILQLSCISNCAAQINPGARLSVTSKCTDNCEGLKYNWSLSRYNETKKIWQDKDIWPDQTLTKKDSASLVVKAGTFEEKQAYIFKLNVTNDHDKTGFVSYEVTTNSPPYGGTCNFFPMSGFAMKTNFTFTCQNWKDDGAESDAILSYKVLYSFDKNEPSVLLYHGPNSAVSNLKLPAGYKENNFTFTLSINVEDVFKAYTTKDFEIKVEPESVDLKKLTNSSNEVGQLLGSGDIQAANRLAITIVRGLVSDNLNENYTKKESEKEKEVNSSKTTKLKVENLHRILKGLKIFNNIVKNISDNFPADLDSMRQSIGTIVTAASLQENISKATQNDTLKALSKTSKKLQTESKEDIGNEIIEEVSKSLMTGIGSIFQASSKMQASIRKRQENNETVSSDEILNVEKDVEQALNVVTEMSAAILQKKVPNEQVVKLDGNNLQVSFQRVSSEILSGSSVEFSKKTAAQIRFPSGFDAKSLGMTNDVDVVALFLQDSPYQSSNTSKVVDSSSVSLELKHRNGSIIEVADLPEHLMIVVPRKQPEIEDSIPINKSETTLDGLVVHVLKLNSQNNALLVEIHPDDPMTNVTIYGRREAAPSLETYDFRHSFPNNFTQTQSNSTSNSSVSPVKHFLDNGTVNGLKYYIGVRSGLQMNYTFKSYEVGCYYYYEKGKNWTNDGCTPANSSTKEVVHCRCNHATLFGSSFFVAPNSLDVGEEIGNLGNLADYPALLATICVIGGFYIIGMVWALRKDRKKSYKTTLHCAADNEPYDSYKYEVTLFTGSRRNAGSTAEVSIIITGDNGDSEPRLLQRTSSVSFKRTSQDSYLVTTTYALGSLQYIRIWHDNSGTDPSWFLSEVIIRDVESGEQYFFLCNSWLACDEGDGLVERLVPVAGPEELKDFQYLFMQNSTQGFSDGHLWFSIVLRPAQSRFTHAQRVTCCLCLLLCTMLVNAMFYRVTVAAENNVDVDVGPFQITWHEVMVGIQSSLIVFPINLLIVTIFRRIAVRPTKSSKYLSGNSYTKSKKPYCRDVAVSLGDIEMSKNGKNQADQTQNAQSRQPAVKMRLLPWWFVFVGWFLVIATTLTAGFFTLLYGLKFGKRRQEQWLTALVISVFQDVLVSQPIKILLLSVFLAFVIRKPTNVDINEENDILMQDEEWIQESLYKANPDGILRSKTQRKPPDELILRKMRLFRHKERKMFGVCHEVLQFFFFWWVVLMIAYGHREPDAHRLSTSMENTFVDLSGESQFFTFKRHQSKHDIYMTKSKRDVLMWVREVIIPGLYHEKWYNNGTDKQPNFISDAVGFLIGSPRVRLLRIKKNSCNIAKEFEDKVDGCESEYSFSHEYREKFNFRNWRPSNSSASDYMWQYRTQSELDEIPLKADHATYRGGGYVLKLNKKKDKALQQIKDINETWWINGETRAVFIEFSLFYPGRNLHCIITIIFECPATGGCSPSFRIQATRLDELVGNYRIFVLACELVFVISIAVFTYKILKDMVRQGFGFCYYFWNWVELGIIAVGWMCFAFYIVRFIANKWTKSKFYDNPDDFVSFRYVAIADQAYGIVIALLVFLTSIKFLRLFRFNRRMSLLGSTLKYAAWDMFNFLILFAVAFVACVSVAYLLFQTNIDMFSSFLSTTETLINIILGKFKYMNLSHDTFLASAVVLGVYCVVVVFILINVFLVILNDAFQVVKSNNDLQENEHEIIDYMMSRLKSWLGFRTKPSPQVSDFEHEYGFKPTYVAPIKKKYQIPATAVLDRKMEELLRFVEKQAHRHDVENMRVDQFKDEASKKKALLLLMS